MNNDDFFRSLKFTLPISLIAWALFVWLVLAVFSAQARDVVYLKHIVIVQPSNLRS